MRGLRGGAGKAVSARELANIFRRLENEGAHNIDLVTGTHFIPAIIEERMEPFLDELCTRKPDTPILFLGAPPVLNAWLKPERLQIDERKISLMGEIAKKMKKKYAKDMEGFDRKINELGKQIKDSSDDLKME